MKQLRQYIRTVLLEGIQVQRLHHSRDDEILKLLQPQSQPSASDQIGPKKPTGLWYDCGNVWQEFCNIELGGYSHRGYDSVYEVFLNEEKILFITNDSEFDQFETEYGRKGKFELVIDWNLVSKKYAGIEICPYLPSKRQRHFWYYSWDVASGCIWHPDGIKNLKKKC
tara:strand:- start:45399 stop:45902 length:504 start_codon:yes stop_codon:yes gene_type:complete